jgi:hypothetical protein
MKNLEELSLNELIDLEVKIGDLIALKHKENKSKNNVFEYDFEYTVDPRKQGAPYAARLTIDDGDGTLNRTFFHMKKEYGKNEVAIIGTYTAKVGDIIEEREGGSWKNEHRYWYLILEDGTKEIVVDDIKDPKQKTKVKKYLKGEITAEDLRTR